MASMYNTNSGFNEQQKQFYQWSQHLNSIWFLFSHSHFPVQGFLTPKFKTFPSICMLQGEGERERKLRRERNETIFSDASQPGLKTLGETHI